MREPKYDFRRWIELRLANRKDQHRTQRHGRKDKDKHKIQQRKELTGMIRKQ
jgi:hypothetical protein